MRNFARILLLGVIAALAFQSTAWADGGCGNYGYGYPWFGYGNNGPAAYALGNIPTPPYFALHPPVYYSHPVSRTYGHSPFACPYGCPNHAERTRVRVLANPYVEWEPLDAKKPEEKKTDSTKSQTRTKVAAVPVRITNPFFRSDVQESIADSRMRSAE